MATQVASLYAELGIKDTGLKQGLASAKTGMQDLKKDTQRSGFAFTEFNSALALATRALDFGKAIIGETAGAALNLGMRVKDAARAI